MIGASELSLLSQAMTEVACFAPGKSSTNQCVTRLFLATTLFDTYCSKLHVGLAISSEQAKRLTTCICETINDSDLAILQDTASGYVNAAKSVLSNNRYLSQLKHLVAKMRVVGTNQYALVNAIDIDSEIPTGLFGPLDQVLSDNSRVIAEIKSSFCDSWREHHAEY